MRKLTVLAAGLLLAAAWLPAHADSSSGPVTCSDGTTSAHAGKGACSHHGGIKKDAGAPAGSPAAAAAAPAAAAAEAKAATTKPTKVASTASADTGATGATAKCKDGSYSHAAHHEGACSHHGGVAEFMDKK